MGAPNVWDAAVHVWAPDAEAAEFPYPGGVPPCPGSTELLFQRMDAAGVDAAVVVQPINHKFDHSYVSRALNRHPQRLFGMLLADPTPGGGGEPELRRLVAEEGFRGARFNPGLFEDENMDCEVGRAMFRACGDLGVPVGFMTFKGFSLYSGAILGLLRHSPATPVIIDHFGFCRGVDTPEFAQLLQLADFQQVHVKLSAFFRVSSAEAPPFTDTTAMVAKLLEAFGPERLMLGTDFPFVEEVKGGYSAAADVLRAQGGLGDEELAWVCGGTARKLFLPPRNI